MFKKILVPIFFGFFTGYFGSEGIVEMSHRDPSGVVYLVLGAVIGILYWKVVRPHYVNTLD